MRGAGPGRTARQRPNDEWIRHGVGLTDVVSFAPAPGTASRRAPTAASGPGATCEGAAVAMATMNLNVPTKVALPAGVAVPRSRRRSGTCCGRRRLPAGVRPTVRVVGFAPLRRRCRPACRRHDERILGFGGANAAISSDGCDVRWSRQRLRHRVDGRSGTARFYFLRPNLSLCAPRSTDAGGDDGPRAARRRVHCWTTRVQRTCGDPALRRAARRDARRRGVVNWNAAFLPRHSQCAAHFAVGWSHGGFRRPDAIRPCPSGSRTARACGRRLEVIPQVDRIGEPSPRSRSSSTAPRAHLHQPGRRGPEADRHVGGYPEYDGGC